MVVDPLKKVSSTKKELLKNRKMFKVNNKTLPLAYLDFKGFRIIFPSSLKSNDYHDMCIFQLENITLNPTPDNPICRNPCRPDIYQKATQARMLQVPGE